MLCPLDLESTAVVGGSMTPDRVEKARAPWTTWLPDTDQPISIIRTLAERGELDGRVAVYAAVTDKDDLDNQVLPTLDKLGIETVATGIMDAPTGGGYGPAQAR